MNIAPFFEATNESALRAEKMYRLLHAMTVLSRWPNNRSVAFRAGAHTRAAGAPFYDPTLELILVLTADLHAHALEVVSSQVRI